MKNRNLGEKMGQNTKEGDRRQYIVPLKKKKSKERTSRIKIRSKAPHLISFTNQI